MIALSDSHENLQNLVKRIILYEWDPIGVGQIPEAYDEYDAYILVLCGLILRGSSVGTIYSYLRKLETEHIGLKGDEKFTLEIANRIHRIPIQRPL